MTSERRYLWIAVVVVALVSLGLFLIPKLREELAPEPRSALVAVEIDGSGVGEIGRVDIEAGQRFVLHAVLVATDRRGDPVYYTEVPALRIGGEPVARDRCRVWDRSDQMVVLWFTVEGFRPYMELRTSEELESFHFEEMFRPEWGRGWSISGSVTPRNLALARGFESDSEIPFGTARYHVRIEKYLRAGDPAPVARYRSPGANEMLGDGDRPTSVVSTLPGGLKRTSAVFGTPHLEAVDGAQTRLLADLSRWYAQGLGFSRLLVLGGLLRDLGLSWSELVWTPIDLEVAPRWGEISSGDLLRSGERLIVLYADRGVVGRLDYGDLCFDLAESAAVRRLEEVFSGGGVLDWADLDRETGDQ